MRRTKSLFQILSNMSLLSQLVITFSVILAVNIVLGIYFTTKIRNLKSLVEIMYDKPLMSSTYAMSAKYRFERADSLMRTVFFENDFTQIEKLKKEINSQLEQGSEDLAIVQERAYAESSKQIAARVQAQVGEYKKLIDEYLKKSTEPDRMKQTVAADLKILHEYLAIDIRNSIQKDLTDLTDDAAETGYTFRLDSEARNAETVLFFYAGSASMFLVIIGLAFLLSRTIAKPLSKYSETCELIAKGDFSKRVQVFGEKSEISILGKAFNVMIDKVVEKDRNMNSLLGGLSTGVFSFDQNMEILPEKSSACQSIFENYKVTNMVQFLKDFSSMDEDEIKNAISLFWNTEISMDFDGITGVLPSKVRLRKNSEDTEKIVSLTYKQNLNASGQLEQVIVLADDITAKLAFEKNSIVQTERVDRITKASLSSESYIESKNNFIQLIEESRAILKKGITEIDDNELSHLKRQLHSLKGELALMGHKACAEQVHHIESALLDDPTAALGLKLMAEIANIEMDFKNQSMDVLNVLGLDENTKTIKVNVEKIEQLLSDVEQSTVFSNVQKLELSKKLKSLLQKPLQYYLSKFENYVQETAEKLDKKATLVFDPSSAEVTLSEVQSLDFILGHLIRNSLDHGIEDSDIREEKGKPATGQIKIKAQRPNEGQGLEFIISDDGQGIDYQRLIDKALQKELWTAEQARSANRQEALDLIFRSDFSTKEVVTDTSGRGVGMDAVRAEVEKLGGTIALETSIGHGTKFTIRIS